MTTPRKKTDRDLMQFNFSSGAERLKSKSLSSAHGVGLQSSFFGRNDAIEAVQFTALVSFGHGRSLFGSQCLETNRRRSGSWRNARIEKARLYLVNQIGQCRPSVIPPRDDKGNLDATPSTCRAAPCGSRPRSSSRNGKTRCPTLPPAGVGWQVVRRAAWSSSFVHCAGEKVDMPMPAYRMTVDDAKAVTAYLRSLPGKKK